MELTTVAQVTIDGVTQGNGGASEEDRRNGRRTYELVAGSWGSLDQLRAHPIGVALSEAPKYVASTTIQVFRPAGRPRYATA